jgi:hypothetical protein
MFYLSDNKYDMILNPNNVVLETSNTAGTGTFTLQGAANASVETFFSAFANNQTVGYFIQDIGGNSGQPTGILEVGIGQFITNSTANSLIRSFVLNNSYGVGNTSFVNFPGNSLVFYNQSAYSSYYANAAGGTPGGSNTDIQFNNSGVFGGSNGLQFNSSTNTISIGNSTINSTVNSSAFSLQGTPVLSLDGQYIELRSGNSSTYILVGNSDSEGYMFGNWIVQGALDPYSDATYSLGVPSERWTNFYTVSGSFGNSTANVVANSTQLTLSNSVSSTIVTPEAFSMSQGIYSLSLGAAGAAPSLSLQSNSTSNLTLTTTSISLNVNSTANAVANSSGIYSNGTLLGTGSGFVNKFRNGTMDIWLGGNTGTSNTTSGTNQLTATGWYVIPSGANCTWLQAGGRLLTANSLQVNGASSITDILIKQRIESYISAPLTNQTVTVQAQIFNGNGGTTITPTLTVKHANTTDTWTNSNTDISAVNLQSCANNTWTQVAYTFSANQYSGQGLEITIDMGNSWGGTTQYFKITELDIRATPGATVGLNSSPPVPEMRPIDTELHFCQRYFQTSYGSGVTPGTATYLGIVGGPQNDGTTTGAASMSFETTMRATPSVVYWDGAGNGSKVSYISSSGTTFTDNSTIPNAPFNVSRRGFIINGSNAVAHVNVFLHYQALAEL